MNDRMDEIRSTRAPTLREDQIGILRRYGQERKTEIGDVLFSTTVVDHARSARLRL
jgi:hypothetical protein